MHSHKHTPRHDRLPPHLRQQDEHLDHWADQFVRFGCKERLAFKTFMACPERRRLDIIREQAAAKRAVQQRINIVLNEIARFDVPRVRALRPDAEQIRRQLKQVGPIGTVLDNIDGLEDQLRLAVRAIEAQMEAQR